MDNDFYYKKGLCGLKNLGNTCYINSITQCLNNNRPFIDYLVSESYKDDLNHNCSIGLLEHFIELSKNLRISISSIFSFLLLYFNLPNICKYFLGNE